MEKISISSDAFEDGGIIQAKYTCDGDNRSLSWDGIRKNTRSIGLIIDDPDVPGLSTA